MYRYLWSHLLSCYMQEEALLYEATVLNKRTHSVNLMPMVDDAIIKKRL